MKLGQLDEGQTFRSPWRSLRGRWVVTSHETAFDELVAVCEDADPNHIAMELPPELPVMCIDETLMAS